jgi:DNA repair exonuclease SbcCD nuclease subunit
MIKKIIHIADIHIRTYRMHDEYKEIFTTFIDRIAVQTKDFKFEEIRIAVVGDLVHQKITISNEQLILSCWFLNQLSEIGKVILVAGNHDLLENNKDRMDSITPMIELLDNPNIAYYKDSECYHDDNVVWCNYSIFNENKGPDINAEQIKHQDDDLTYIGLYHAPLAGATTDIGYEFKEGTALEHFEGCDMVLLGDIHKRQLFFHGETPIAYPSSLIQQNFGETVSKHGYLYWDVAQRTFTEHDIPSRYGFYQFKVNTVDDIDNEKEKFLNP